MWVLSVPLAILSRFTNKQSLVWDVARKAVTRELKSRVDAVLSLSLESFQDIGQRTPGSHSVIITGMDQHSCKY